MSLELHYTSAPKLLRSSGAGFGTVATTPNFPPQLADRLEGLSGYRHVFPPSDPNAKLNPLVQMHLHLLVGKTTYHVLTRNTATDLDYTSRSNNYAHHLILERGELVDPGPAWLLSYPGLFEESWSGAPRILPSGRSIPQGSRSAAVCQAWQAQTGDAGWAGVVADRILTKSDSLVALVYQPGMDLLPLIDEVIGLLPIPKRWQVTFSTYYTGLSANLRCQIRGVLADSHEAKQLKRIPGVLLLDLTSPLGRAAESPLADFARTGTEPALPQPAAPPPSRPKTTLQYEPEASDSFDRGNWWEDDDDEPLYPVAPPPITRQPTSRLPHHATVVTAQTNVEEPKRSRSIIPVAVGIIMANLLILGVAIGLVVAKFGKPDEDAGTIADRDMAILDERDESDEPFLSTGDGSVETDSTEDSPVTQTEQSPKSGQFGTETDQATGSETPPQPDEPGLQPSDARPPQVPDSESPDDSDQSDAPDLASEQPVPPIGETPGPSDLPPKDPEAVPAATTPPVIKLLPKETFIPPVRLAEAQQEPSVILEIDQTDGPIQRLLPATIAPIVNIEIAPRFLEGANDDQAVEPRVLDVIVKNQEVALITADASAVSFQWRQDWVDQIKTQTDASRRVQEAMHLVDALFTVETESDAVTYMLRPLTRSRYSYDLAQKITDIGTPLLKAISNNGSAPTLRPHFVLATVWSDQNPQPVRELEFIKLRVQWPPISVTELLKEEIRSWEDNEAPEEPLDATFTYMQNTVNDHKAPSFEILLNQRDPQTNTPCLLYLQTKPDLNVLLRDYAKLYLKQQEINRTFQKKKRELSAQGRFPRPNAKPGKVEGLEWSEDQVEFFKIKVSAKIGVRLNETTMVEVLRIGDWPDQVEKERADSAKQTPITNEP